MSPELEEWKREQEEVVKGWRSVEDKSKRNEYLKALELRKSGKAPLYYLRDGRGYWPDGTIHK